MRLKSGETHTLSPVSRQARRSLPGCLASTHQPWTPFRYSADPASGEMLHLGRLEPKLLEEGVSCGLSLTV